MDAETFVTQLQRKGYRVNQVVRTDEFYCQFTVNNGIDDEVTMHATDAIDLANGRKTLAEIVTSYGGKRIAPSPFDQISQ
jgi:hypothetical protein